MIEFQYSYPLGKKKEKESELLAYFEKDTLNLNRLIIRANSLNITKPFTLYAVQPITPMYYSKEDMEFSGVRCTKASEQEQSKLDYYVDRVFDIIFNT